MTLLDFTIAKSLLEGGVSFEALLAAVVLRATPSEVKKLAEVFPKEVTEVRERDHARSGVLSQDGVNPRDTVKVNRMERTMRIQAAEKLKGVGVMFK